ncbi:hypothetical protein, partial [Streptomyces mirabilis]|uniref:hypothetical protein n=1 Tax=Streptomyces mirabilis TaxID=68239 RepID=UPI0038050F89
TRRNDAHRKPDHGHCQPSAGTELSSITRDRTPTPRNVRSDFLYEVQGGTRPSELAAVAD